MTLDVPGARRGFDFLLTIHVARQFRSDPLAALSPGLAAIAAAPAPTSNLMSGKPQ